MDMTSRDFSNPWNFYSLMMLSDDEAYQWIRRQFHATQRDVKEEWFLNRQEAWVERCLDAR